MSYLIIGASSGLGKEIAYEFARNKKNLIISSRDIRDLESLKYDIETKFKVKVRIIQIDLSLIEKVKKKINFNKIFFKNIDGVLFPIGQMYNDDNIVLDAKKAYTLLSSNFLSIAYLISNYIKYKKRGSIIGFGSVSAQLGRKINPYYSASKRALESFFESLIFQCSNKNYYIQFYVLGYLKTNLSFGKNLLFPRGSTNKLAKLVYKNRFLKNKRIYFPHWWTLIVLIIKLLPLKFLIFFSKFLNK